MIIYIIYFQEFTWLFSYSGNSVAMLGKEPGLTNFHFSILCEKPQLWYFSFGKQVTS
jgi:hypothetical protein